MAEINLLDIYRRTFGYVASPFSNTGVTAYVPGASAFNQESSPERAPKEYNSVFGMPIFMPVVLEIPGVIKWKCPNEPVVTINLNKKIIETEIDSQDGSFMELYSMGNYDVTIEGVIINEEDWYDEAYPADELRKLRQIVEHKGSVKVYCDQLALWNVNELAIFSMSLPAVPGQPSAAAYTLTCKSDRNFDLEVKKP